MTTDKPCPTCNGSGEVRWEERLEGSNTYRRYQKLCPDCSGKAPAQEKPQFTPAQLAILGLMAETDPDYCFGYGYFKDCGYSRPELETAMRDLRKRGYVYFARGLMNEDGQVAGSGYGMVYEKINEIHEIVDAADNADTFPSQSESELPAKLRELVKNSGLPYGRERGDLYRAVAELVEQEKRAAVEAEVRYILEHMDDSIFSDSWPAYAQWLENRLDELKEQTP